MWYIIKKGCFPPPRAPPLARFVYFFLATSAATSAPNFGSIFASSASVAFAASCLFSHF